jgi:DNA repair exonuclease SbcCD ATPase subunit
MASDGLDRVFGAPLEDFVSERNALAKELSAAGKDGEAAEVRALKKPSVSTWALNQGVRADPKAAKALLAAAKALESAQDEALQGDGAGLRDAQEQQQRTVDGMVSAVERAVSGRELSAAMLDRIRETLRAIPGDDDLRAEFAAGRVTRDRRAVGFTGAIADVSSRPARKRAGKSAPRKREAERRLTRAQKDLEAARERLDTARGSVEQLEEQLKAGRRRAKEAEAALSEAKAELRAAEKEAKRAG